MEWLMAGGNRHAGPGPRDGAADPLEKIKLCGIFTKFRGHGGIAEKEPVGP